MILTLAMDKLQLTGQNLGRVFNSRSGRVHALQFHFSEMKQPNLKLKTRPKQLLGSLPLVIPLPALACFVAASITKKKSFITLTPEVSPESKSKTQI
jgi:hypothetical protein